MGADKNLINRVTLQFMADCGIDGAIPEGYKGVSSPGKTRGIRIGKAPEIEKGFLSDAAYGEAVREKLRKRTGIIPRIYEGTSPFFRAIAMGRQTWMMADGRILEWCENEYIKNKKDMEWLGQYGELERLNRQLRKYGHGVIDCRIGMLPATDMPAVDGMFISDMGRKLEIRFLDSGDILNIRDRYPFRHALCDSEWMPCELAAAAVSDGRIIAMAGAAADCPEMWQIGVDVLPGWEGKGIASGLVGILAKKVLDRGKIPFYSTSQTHIVSLNVALSAGFVPGWAEIFVR